LLFPVAGDDPTMESATPPIAPAGRRRSWYVLALLFGVYVMNMADRQIVGILAEDIKRDLQLSDGQIGILAGPAIAFFYAILGVPMAYAADRINRVRFIAGCIAVWSAMTMLGGRAGSLVELAATRVGVSIAEAGGSPSSVSLIADHFPARQRATAMAVWTSATTLGIFVGFAIGGVVNQQLGWRATFFAAGIPGLVLALLLVTTVREPVRGAADAAPAITAGSKTLFATFAHLWRIKPFRQAVFAVALCNFCVFAVLSWAPPFAVRRFALGTAEVGGVMGTGIALAGGTMMVLAGIATDLLGRKGLWRPPVAVAAMLLLSAVLFTGAFFATSFHVFAVLFVLGYATLMTNPPISWVILQAYSPPEMRGMATAVLLLVIALTASVPAPLIVGYASEALEPSIGAASLGHALLVAPLAVVAAAIQFLRVSRTIRREAPLIM
jgi:predicted MFS family arabinose efflux permease